MVIIFYDTDEQKYYIASEYEKMRAIDINDQNLMDYIPNDDILYVENAHFMTKKQFQTWIAEDTIVEDTKEVSRFAGFLDSNIVSQKSDQIQKYNQTQYDKQYIHPAHNGTIIIPDIVTEKFPAGVIMNGKWDFIDVDDLGGIEALKSSPHFCASLKKKKVEIVDSAYVKKNIHKKKKTESPSEASLNAMLVPVGMGAKDVAEKGGIHSGPDIPEFLVEG